MMLKILLPNKIYAQHNNVLRIIVETPQGSYGILPNRRDCSGALAPGILTYETTSAKESYIAIDQGIFVKKGSDVFVSVRRAIQGIGLSQLQQAVTREFLNLDKKQQAIRFAMDKLESSFSQRLSAFSTQERQM